MDAVISKSAEIAPSTPTFTPPANAVSNMNKPVLKGLGTAGSLITIMDGTKVLGTTTVGLDGTWSYTPATALTDGVHQLAAKASSSSTSTTFSALTTAIAYTVDTKPPAAPVITTKTSLTNNGKISLAGTAEAGATIKIMDAGTLVATVVADAKGAWAYAPATAYKDGEHNFTVTATDAAGNVSTASAALALTIDATPPEAPTVTTASLLTNNFKPLLSGIAEAKSTVKIYDNGTALGTAVADATGKWTFTPSTAFSEGGHSITARATDAAGNMSAASTALNVVTTSKILSAWGASEILSGQDGKSQTLRPTLAGFNGDKVWTEVSAASDQWATQKYITANVNVQTQDRLGGLAAGETVQIATTTINNRGLGVVASSNLYHTDQANTPSVLGGVWWLDAGSAQNNSYSLNYKSYTFAPFTAGSNAGSVTDLGETQVLLTGIDLSKQAVDKNYNFNWAATANGFAFEWDELVAGSTTEKVANIAMFDVTGAQIGATTVSDPMAVGVLTNLGTDPYGNYDFLTFDRSAAQPLLTLTTMKTDGSQSIHDLTVNFAKDMGTTSTGGFNWIYANKDAAGNFLNIEFAVSGIRNGRAVIDFIQTDTDLNMINTKSVDLYDATNPDNAVGRIRAARLPDTATTVFGFQTGTTLHLLEMDAKGNIAQDFTQTLGANIIFDRLTVLNDGRVEISLLTKGATNSAATLVQTQIFDTRTSALSVSGGTGLIAGTALADTIAMTSDNAVVEGGAGADKLSATGKNATLSYEHSSAAVQIDLAKKTAAGGDATGDTISGFANITGSQFADTLVGDANANVFFGGLGDDTISGGGGADSVVYGGNKADYTITLNKDGSYTIKDKRDGSPDGTDTVKAVSLLSFADGTYNTIDATKAPVITTKMSLTNNASASIAGTAVAGSTVGLFDGTILIGTTTADAKGNWVATPLSKLGEGAHTITAKTVDSGGNTSQASNSLAFTVDTIAPNKPAFSLDAASDTGLSSSDKITNVKKPKINGSAETGSTVTLLEGTTVLGTATVTAGSAGDSFSITSGSLTDGVHVLTVQAKDAAGNISALSNALTLTIDTKAPDTPASPVLDTNSDTGLSAIDGITKISTPVLTGVAEAGSKVEIFDEAKSVGSATAGADGKYSITTSALTDGSHKLTVKATDLAGNTSTASLPLTVVTDTVGPAAPVVSTKSGAVSTNAPTVAGTAEAGATVMIYDEKGNAYGSVIADTKGKWSYTVTKLLADGAYQFVVQALDVAGNNSPKTTPITITVDTVAPDKPKTLALATASDTGLSSSDGITKNNTPTIIGQGEAGSTIKIFEGTTALGTAVVGQDGNFSVVSAKLADGNHVLDAVSIDAAGNQSSLSDPLNISVLTVAPDAPVITTTGIATTAMPTISGTAKPLTTVTLLDGTTVLGTAAVDLKGAWSFVVPAGSSLKDGSHNLTATASDTAGNVSKASAVAALLINTLPIEVTIDQLSKYAGSANVGAFSVKDTAANISKNLDALAATKTLVQIIQTDSPKTIDITATQYNTDLSVFSKFKSNYGLTVTGATIADADILQKDTHVMSFQISETTANIKANFDLLNNKVDLWNNLNTIAPILLKDTGNIALTAAQYLADTKIEAKLPAATGYEITDVQTDANGLSLSKNANIKVINVADSVLTITADLDRLNAAANIKSITFTDTAPAALVISYTQLGADTAAYAKLPTNYKLVVKDVPANQITAVSANTHVASMSVTDSTLNLLALINADSKGITGTIADPKISVITIDETKPSISGSTSTTQPAGISIADAMKIASLSNLSAVPSFKILDTAANIIAHARYDILNVIQHSSKITISDLPPKLTVSDAKLLNDYSAFQITNASMAVSGSAGGPISIASGILTPLATGSAGAYTLTSGTVTGTVTVTGNAGNFTISSGTLVQAGKTVTLSGGTISATPPAHVDASGNPLINGFSYALSDANTVLLDASNANLVKAAKSVTAIHTYSVAEALLLQSPVILTSPFAIIDNAANIIAQAKATGDIIIARANFVIVSDSTVNIGSSIDDLEALAKKSLITDIKLTDTGVTPNLTASQLANDYDALGRIIGLTLSTSTTPAAYAAPTLVAPLITNNKQPTLTGTAKPGATVTVFDGTVVLGTAVADSAGLWSYKITADLSEATHNLTANAATSDGSRTSPLSPVVPMVVDATPPVAPILTVPAASKNNVPTITGTAESNTTISIYDGATLVATTTANALNKWSYTFTKAVADGDHTLTAIATDRAGNPSAASSPAVLTIDTIAPNAPVIATIAATTSNNSTDSTKPTISGTAEKGATVTVLEGTTVLGTAVASLTGGTWSLVPATALSIGTHAITATAKDAVGNSSAASVASSWVVPNPTPQPVVTSLKWSADQLKGYEFSTTTGNKSVSSPSVSETVGLVAGATYNFSAGYGYSYSGTAPSLTLKVMDASGTVVGSSSTPVNGYTFKASSSGVYTVQLSATNATNTAVLTSYTMIGHQMMSALPVTSGDTNVDALLVGGTGQWWHVAGTVPAVSTAPADLIHTGLKSLTAASAQHTITYSFLTALPAGSSSTDSAGFAAMTATQQAAVKKALDYISTLIDVKFVLGTTAGQADINFGQNQQSSSAGYANLPYQGGGHASYLMLASNASTNADFSMGSYGWETLIHEIGHTLGLKHPGNYNAGGGGSPTPYLPPETDTRRYTVMSYNNPADSTNVTAKSVTGVTSYSWTAINPQSYMLYDIEALQYLYGSNDTTAYQNVVFGADYKGMQTIWAPTGGKIDASAMSNSNIIDLRAGFFSSIGIQGPSNLPSQIAAYQTYTGMNNVAIAYGSTLNEAVGGSGNDAFYVNTGSDTIDGGLGTDIVYLSGSAADWTVTGTGANQTATNKITGAVDILKNIETIAYYDSTVTTPIHSAPLGLLSQSVSAFVQSVAAMAPQSNSGTILPSNDGMMLQTVTTLTNPV
jgi:large repetitive protein